MTSYWRDALLLYCIFLIVGFFLLLAIDAAAVTLVEPTTRADGAPLSGLKSCTYTVSAPGQTPGSTTIPASSPSGGGSHLVVSSFEGPVTVTATCVREVGGVESPPSATASLSTSFPVGAPAAPELHP